MYMQQMAVKLRHSFLDSLSDDWVNNEVTMETRHRILIALGVFSWDFHTDPKYIISERPSHRCPKNIPFISLMGLPPPSSPNAARDLATCHLSKMTSKEFFNDGLWIYGHSIGNDMGFSSVPVRRVAFVATQDEAHSTKLTLCGFGAEYGRDFSLEGAIAQETGRVYLVKRDTTSTVGTNQFGTELSGLMTPFGIVGVHGTMDMGGDGWFWLWKDAWTEKGMSPPYAW